MSRNFETQGYQCFGVKQIIFIFADKGNGGTRFGQCSAVPTGGPRGLVPPLTTACAPSSRTILNTFLEHHVTTRKQTITEKGIITFKLNSRLKLFPSLRNFWPPTVVHKCGAIIRLINTP